MKHTPYTTKTGIQIGSRYQEHGITMPIDDPNMIRIQEALLATPEYAQQKRRNNLLNVVYLAGLLFVTFYYLLFR
jgi:hypothetical protein